MSAGEGINRERCDWCRNTGMLTAYHRDYRGKDDVWEDRIIPGGEVRQVRVPGIIAVHCNCNLGAWMHGQTDDKIRHRIPTWSQIVNGCGRYAFERADVDESDELTPETKALLARLKTGFTFPRPPQATRNDPVEMSNELRARNARIEAEAAREEVEIA